MTEAVTPERVAKAIYARAQRKHGALAHHRMVEWDALTPATRGQDMQFAANLIAANPNATVLKLVALAFRGKRG